MKIFRVVVAADPISEGERRSPHATLYVEATNESAAGTAGLMLSHDRWADFAVVPPPPSRIPSSGYRIVSCEPLTDDELSAYRHHALDFEVSDRWRRRRGLDLLEGGEVWWVTMGELRRALAKAIEDKQRLASDNELLRQDLERLRAALG
jgi:hypothetical protein